MSTTSSTAAPAAPYFQLLVVVGDIEPQVQPTRHASYEACLAEARDYRQNDDQSMSDGLFALIVNPDGVDVCPFTGGELAGDDSMFETAGDEPELPGSEDSSPVASSDAGSPEPHTATVWAFSVTVARVSKRTATFDVQTTTAFEAESLAIDAAANFDYGNVPETDTDYEVVGITTPRDAADPDQGAVTIRAEAHSDDHAFEVSFDATAWFEQAPDETLRQLHERLNESRWGHCGVADAIAYHYERRAPYLASMLEHCRQTQHRKEPVGFEVKVNVSDFMAWLRIRRPVLWAVLLCNDNGIRLIQATEPEVLGRWDWIGKAAASDTSFATEHEAALDAINTCGLT